MPTILITGCSSGIGRALADAFRDAGHQVWATARKPEDVERLAAAGFAARQLDVTHPDDLARLADELQDRHGGLDILINNAGYGAIEPARRWRRGHAPAVRDQCLCRGRGHPRAVPAAASQPGPGGEHRQRVGCTGHPVRWRLLRLQGGRECPERCPAPGARAVRHSRDGSAARSHRLAVRRQRST